MVGLFKVIRDQEKYSVNFISASFRERFSVVSYVHGRLEPVPSPSRLSCTFN